MKKQQVIYYSDELNDEFSTAKITPKKIDGNYKYIHKSIFKKFTHFFWYRMVAYPIAFLYLKLWYRHKIIGKKQIKKEKGGYILYGNHTHAMCDALIPTFVSYPKHAYVIVHPNNVSMPFLGRITPSLGAIPLPDDLDSSKNFVEALKYRVGEDKCVMIYPEAHIWPFYTKIRPFTSLSFRYPVQFNKPVYCFTNTYQKRRFVKHPRIVTYVDGPFYPNSEKSAKENRENLRNIVYETMVKRSENNSQEVIKYIKKEA